MLKNKLNITDEVELSKIEEKITKLKALELYDSGKINTVEVGTFKGLAQIHNYLSSDIYEELIESGYYNHNNKRVQFKDEFNSIVYKISEHINEKYKDKEFSEYLLEQSLI